MNEALMLVGLWAVVMLAVRAVFWAVDRVLGNGPPVELAESEIKTLTVVVKPLPKRLTGPTEELTEEGMK